MKKGVYLLCTVFLTATTTVWAADGEESYSSYESLVTELRADADGIPTPALMESDLNWDEVALHAGMALTTSYVSMSAPNQTSGSGLLKGFEAHIGANLFTKKARGELLFRNYAPEELSAEMNADLTEVEARAVLLPALNSKTNLRMGFGLGIRYMDISTVDQGQTQDYSSTVGATTVLLGLERRISKAVSVGPDFAYRSTLSATSFDKSAWDAAIRLNATF